MYVCAYVYLKNVVSKNNVILIIVKLNNFYSNHNFIYISDDFNQTFINLIRHRFNGQNKVQQNF